MRELLENVPTPSDLEATGNCYEVAGSAMLFKPKAGNVLVHGRPTLRRPPFVEFGHAWIENGEMVRDDTSGFEGPRMLYYALGQIDYRENLVYTAKEVWAFTAHFGHWGPWEGPDKDGRTREARKLGPKAKAPKRSLKSKPVMGMEGMTMREVLEAVERGVLLEKSGLQKFLDEHGIVGEKAAPDHTTNSIGFSEKEGKWYGWSHRAIAGFGVGDMIFEPDFGDDKTPYAKHGSKKIEDLDDAKKAAKAFARHVS